MSCLDVANCGNCVIVWHLILKNYNRVNKSIFVLKRSLGLAIASPELFWGSKIDSSSPRSLSGIILSGA